MNMEITIVKTFCDFGHNFFKKQPFFIRSLAISYEKNLATLFRARPLFVLFPKLTEVQQHKHKSQTRARLTVENIGTHVFSTHS